MKSKQSKGKIKTYFIAVMGYRNQDYKYISGLFDTYSNNEREVWKEAKEFYKV